MIAILVNTLLGGLVQLIIDPRSERITKYYGTKRFLRDRDNLGQLV